MKKTDCNEPMPGVMKPTEERDFVVLNEETEAGNCTHIDRENVSKIGETAPVSGDVHPMEENNEIKGKKECTAPVCGNVTEKVPKTTNKVWENASKKLVGEKGNQTSRKGISNRGRGGMEGFRGGRGGAAGRGLNPGAVPYEPGGYNHGEEVSKQTDKEHHVQKELFKEEEKEKEVLGNERTKEGEGQGKKRESRVGREGGKSVNKRNYYGVLPVDVDGDDDISRYKEDEDPENDRRKEGEIEVENMGDVNEIREIMVQDIWAWCRRKRRDMVVFKSDEPSFEAMIQMGSAVSKKRSTQVNCLATFFANKFEKKSLWFLKVGSLPRGFFQLLDLEGIPHFVIFPGHDVVRQWADDGGAAAHSPEAVAVLNEQPKAKWATGMSTAAGCFLFCRLGWIGLSCCSLLAVTGFVEGLVEHAGCELFPEISPQQEDAPIRRETGEAIGNGPLGQPQPSQAHFTGDLAKKRPQTRAEATSFGFDTVIFGFTNLTGDLAKKRPETRAEATSFGFDTVSDECKGNGSKLWLQADRREVTRLEGIQKQILAQDMMLPPKGVLK
nr:uncharacterized protein LOC109162453 [Ipomoea batatas]